MAFVSAARFAADDTSGKVGGQVWQMKTNGINPWLLVPAFFAGWLAHALLFAAPAIPAVAAHAAMQHPRTEFTRFLWLRSPQDYAAVAMTINVAVNQSSVEYAPPVVANGMLALVDLAQLADDEKQLARVVATWDWLAFFDPYFHLRADIRDKAVVVPAPHLGIAMPVGLVYRADWFVAKSLSSIDGGAYLTWRGLTPGKTTLEGYLTSRGASLENSKRLNAVERAGCMSQVTGKPRAIYTFYGQGVRPSTSIPLASVTDDPFDGRIPPDKDPFLSLLNSKPDGHEVFVTLPTGWLEYTLFDGNGKLVAEAPPNLVSDHNVPQPFTRRLHGAISCIRCHGPNDGWQPFRNEVADTFRSHGRLLSDLSKGVNKQFQATRQIVSFYAADQSDIDGRIQDARDAWDKRVFAVTKLGAKDASAATAAVYDGYEYTLIDASLACRELGFDVPAADTLGTNTFRKLIPPVEASGSIPDHGHVSRLASDYLDLTTKQRKGLTITRRQWEEIYPFLQARAMPVLEQVAREQNKHGFNLEAQ